MSDYTVNCPKCNAALQVKDEWADTEAECPICHAVFTVPPRSTQAGYDYATLAVSPGLRGEMHSYWKRLRLWTILGLSAYLACLIFFVLSVGAMEKGDKGAGVVLVLFFAFPLGIFGLVAAILSLVFFCKLMYRYWACIGTGDDCTPGQMVGFCFIPFFNLYWIFRAFWGLAKRLRQAGCVNVNPAMALVYCILVCASAVVPYFGSLCGTVAIVFYFIMFSQFDRAFVGDGQG